MAKLNVIRERIDKKLFNLNILGSEVSITPINIEGSATFGGYINETEVEGTTVETIAVPYNKTKFSLSSQPFGDLAEDEIMMVFRYDTIIDRNYKVTYNSQSWRVKTLKDIPMNNGIIAIICVLKKDPSG